MLRSHGATTRLHIGNSMTMVTNLCVILAKIDQGIDLVVAVVWLKIKRRAVPFKGIYLPTKHNSKKKKKRRKVFKNHFLLQKPNYQRKFTTQKIHLS